MQRKNRRKEQFHLSLSLSLKKRKRKAAVRRREMNGEHAINAIHVSLSSHRHPSSGSNESLRTSPTFLVKPPLLLSLSSVFCFFFSPQDKRTVTGKRERDNGRWEPSNNGRRNLLFLTPCGCCPSFVSDPCALFPLWLVLAIGGLRPSPATERGSLASPLGVPAIRISP